MLFFCVKTWKNKTTWEALKELWIDLTKGDYINNVVASQEKILDEMEKIINRMNKEK